MKVIGLCGGSGSGKGYISHLFLQYGIPTLDTDAVYRTLTAGPSPCVSELSARFGATVVGKDGGLDRAALRGIIFGDKNATAQKLALLNRITHKYIWKETEKWLQAQRQAGTKVVLIDAPVLYESGFDRACEAVIAVLCPAEERRRRIMSRDGLDSESAQRRMDAQMPDEELVGRADYCIRNGPQDQPGMQVSALAMQLLNE